MTQYLAESSSITPVMIDGFFVGWPNPPSAATLITVMDGSEKLGFITGASACVRHPKPSPPIAADHGCAHE